MNGTPLSCTWELNPPKLLNTELYGKAYLELFGPKDLSDRLLFNGKPTYSRESGLVLCSLCEKNGIVPPWREYLQLKRVEQTLNREPTDADICAFQGLIRINGLETMRERFVDWLLENDQKVDSKYFNKIIRMILDDGGPKHLDTMLEDTRIDDTLKMNIGVELLKYFKPHDKYEDAVKIAHYVLDLNPSPRATWECCSLSLPNERLIDHCPDINELTQAITSVKYMSEEVPVYAWMYCVGIMAYVNPDTLAVLGDTIQKEGWYYAWLKFVIELSQAEAKHHTKHVQAARDIVAALSALSTYNSPFIGEPRACDLYSIRFLTNDTFARSLSLLVSDQDWSEALNYLVLISRHTTTYLDGSPSGPLTPESLSEILLKYADNKEVLDIIVNISERDEKSAAFYEIQAEHEIRLAIAFSQAKNNPEALVRWGKAAEYFTAYGFRKDITIWESIDGLPLLSKCDLDFTRNAMASLQQFIYSVVAHTDGRETDHAPNSWFKVLTQIDLVGACLLLATSVSKEGGRIDWRLEDATVDVIKFSISQADPLVLLCLCMTIPFSGTIQEVEERLGLINQLFEKDTIKSQMMFNMICAEMQGDAHEMGLEAYERLLKFAQLHDLAIPSYEEMVMNRTKNNNYKSESEYSRKHYHKPIHILDEPIFSSEAKPIEIMAQLRKLKIFHDSNEDLQQLVNSFGYRLLLLLQAEKEDEAMRLIYDFAHEHKFSSDANPLAHIGMGLERSNYYEIASIAYTLAYTRSHGRGGWSSIGDSKHRKWFNKAVGLSKENAFKTLAFDLSNIIQEYAYSTGISIQLVELFSELNESKIAKRTWNSVFEVLCHRLPWSQESFHPFDKYVPEMNVNYSVDEALAILLCARISHPEQKRKSSAIIGLVEILKYKPEILIPAYKQFLKDDYSFTTQLILLQLIYETFAFSRSTVSALEDEIKVLTNSPFYGTRELSRMLLNMQEKEDERL